MTMVRFAAVQMTSGAEVSANLRAAAESVDAGTGTGFITGELDLDAQARTRSSFPVREHRYI